MLVVSKIRDIHITYANPAAFPTEEEYIKEQLELEKYITMRKKEIACVKQKIININQNIISAVSIEANAFELKRGILKRKPEARKKFHLKHKKNLNH